MKGKGRGKYHDNKDQLQLADFSLSDQGATCSKYSAILQKKEDESVSIEEIDPLQFDLEYLLVAVTKRRNDLEKEMQMLSSLKNRKSLAYDKQESKSNGKRSHLSEGKSTTKKCKDNNGKSSIPPRQKAKVAQPTRITETPVEPAKPKSDTPNRFWSSIEPYFADLTQEHIRFLEEELSTYDHDSEYFEVPKLGKHYGYKWSIKEIQEEQKEGEKVNEKLKGSSNSSSYGCSEAENLLKKFEKENEALDKSFYGPLTTCIINCLVEENIITSGEDNIDSGRDVSTSSTSEKLPKMCLKSMKMSNYVDIEKRLQKTLEEIGILSCEEAEHEDPEDEVFMELRNLQQTLKALCEHNKQQKQRLLEIVKQEMGWQSMRKQLQVVDAEIKECQRKWVILKKKKKTIPNSDRDQIQKVLKKREDLMKNLENKGISLI